MPRESVAARTARLLDEYIEKRRSAKQALGPRAGTELVLRVLEVPSLAVARARRSLRSRDGWETADAVLKQAAIGQRTSQIVGDHEAIKQLLALVPKRVRARRDAYTSSEARELLAALDRLQAKHGGARAKLATVLDEAMADAWPFAVDPPKSVALRPLRWFEAMLRRAVARKHGFAIVFDTTLL